MRSVVTARSWMAAPGVGQPVAGSARPCSRGAWRPGTRSLPDWSGRWSWLQTAGGLGHRRDGLGPQVLRVGAGEPHPADPLDRADRPEQVGEERAAPGQVAAVGVDVLTEQGDLDHARGRPAPRPRPRGRRTGRLTSRPAHRGHDAEGARVVAPGLDGHPGRVGDLAHAPSSGRRGRAPRVGIGRVEDLDHRARSAAAWRRSAGARARLWVPNTTSTWPARWRIELPVLLGQAAADGDLQVRALRPASAFRLPEVAVELVVGVLADAAGVEDHDVGRLERRRSAPARRPTRRPARRSESCSFIWQPKVRMWNVAATRRSVGPRAGRRC